MSEATGPVITVQTDGPHVIRGEIALVDYLGVPIDHEPGARLCRCGLARTKPFCDDACRTDGFTGAKNTRRVPDRLDVYAGEAVTVHHNRGLCAHSGFGTDRVRGVFHFGQEPSRPCGSRVRVGFLDERHGWAGGSPAVFETRDGGKS